MIGFWCLQMSVLGPQSFINQIKCGSYSQGAVIK